MTTVVPPVASAAPTPTPQRRRRIARWKPGTAVAGVVLGIVALLAVGVATELLFGDDLVANGVGLLVGDLVLLGVVALFARRGADRLGPSTLGIRTTPVKTALLWIVGLLLAALIAEGAIVSALTAIFGSGGADSSSNEPGSVSTAAVLLLVAGVAVTAPIAEEIAFRGYLFGALTRWKGPWVGAVLTGVVFGSAHVMSHPLVVLPGLMAMGVALCLVFWFTGSLMPAVAMHSLNNAIVLTIATKGQLWPAIVLAPLATFLLLRPFAGKPAAATSAAPIEDEPAPVARGRGTPPLAAAVSIGVIGLVATLIPFIGATLGVVALVLAFSERGRIRRRGGPIPWQVTVAIGLGAVDVAAATTYFVLGLTL